MLINIKRLTTLTTYIETMELHKENAATNVNGVVKRSIQNDLFYEEYRIAINIKQEQSLKVATITRRCR